MKKSLSLLCALFAAGDFLGLFWVLFRVFHAFSSRLTFFRETSSFSSSLSLECVFVVHPFLQKDIYISSKLS